MAGMAPPRFSEDWGSDCDTPCGAAGRGAEAGTAGLLAADAGAAGAAAAAAANPFTVTTSAPGDTLPPLVTCTFSTTPFAVDGTSMVALSVSSVASGVSKSMVSPGFTMTSMTATDSKVHMSGTRTSMELSFTGAAGVGDSATLAGVAGADGAAAASGADAVAPSAALTVTISAPVDTWPPLVTCTFSTTPLAVDGTSMVALSVSSVTSGVSMSMVSPGFTNTSITVTDSKFPMSGTRTSTVLMLSADPAC